MTPWNFLQTQVLGMAWLNDAIGAGLSALGLDLSTRLGGSVQFFLYDVAKITLLLCFLIFLISSPMVDLGSLVLLMSIFGAKVAVLYTIVGLLVAILGGTLIQRLGMERHVAPFIRAAAGVEIDGPQLTQPDRLRWARDQMTQTFRKVFPYILVGVAVGALIHNWIPQDWIATVLGSDNPFGVVLAVVVGVPMYADIFGTIPVAEALLSKGAQLGTVLAFMMAVTTLSLPSLILLRKAVQPKLLALFIAICTVGIILVGYLFNALQPLLV